MSNVSRTLNYHFASVIDLEFDAPEPLSYESVRSSHLEHVWSPMAEAHRLEQIDMGDFITRRGE